MFLIILKSWFPCLFLLHFFLISKKIFLCLFDHADFWLCVRHCICNIMYKSNLRPGMIWLRISVRVHLKFILRSSNLKLSLNVCEDLCTYGSFLPLGAGLGNPNQSEKFHQGSQNWYILSSILVMQSYQKLCLTF